MTTGTCYDGHTNRGGSMERITEKMLNHMFGLFVIAARDAGALSRNDAITLDGGNATYGYQYRMRNVTTGHSVLTRGQDGLGCTKREAYNALKFATYALDMANEARRLC